MRFWLAALACASLTSTAAFAEPAGQTSPEFEAVIRCAALYEQDVSDRVQLAMDLPGEADSAWFNRMHERAVAIGARLGLTRDQVGQRYSAVRMPLSEMGLNQAQMNELAQCRRTHP